MIGRDNETSILHCLRAERRLADLASGSTCAGGRPAGSRGLVSLDERKTDRPRSWLLDPRLAKVLTAWKEACKAARDTTVFPDVA